MVTAAKIPMKNQMHTCKDYNRKRDFAYDSGLFVLLFFTYSENISID